jgi:hypothetical protein
MFLPVSLLDIPIMFTLINMLKLTFVEDTVAVRTVLKEKILQFSCSHMLYV